MEQVISGGNTMQFSAHASAALAQDPAVASANDGATKAATVGYWVTTGLLVFCMTGGIFELLGAKATIEGIARLGYPSYIIPALGLAKILAILAILWPGLPRLKEWAYAGIFFNMMGALVSHVARHDEPWIIVVNIVIAAIALASWALRPQNRRLAGPRS
jgi:hypothetical protein